MRTTIRLNPRLLAEAKKLAADTNRPLTTVVEDALREVDSASLLAAMESRRGPA